MASKVTQIRVMLVDDDDFSLAILGEAMQTWATVLSLPSVSEAIANLESFEPHVVVTDLNFNGGPDGNQLLRYLYSEFPWVGRVVLSSHAVPELAIARGSEIPPETTYLVKSQLAGSSALKEVVLESLQRSKATKKSKVDDTGRLKISKSQATALKLIAEGKSNASIAEELGITLRAAESLVQRTFAALQLKPDDKTNLRVVATRMWLGGKVTLK
jgi:DNA-binding NarL/FixJ family response regulator